MFRTPFEIVIGTHEATPVPTAARAFGLRHRFAIVQSTHHPDAADMVVDPTALMVVLRAIDQRTESLGTLFWDTAQRQRITRFELEPHYRSRRAENYDHVSAGEWRRGAEICVLLATETWNAIGGPGPYHDSLTYSFYSDVDLSDSLLAALKQAGCEPMRILHGEPARSAALDAATVTWPRRLFIAAFLLLLFASGFAVAIVTVDEEPTLFDYAARAGWGAIVPVGLSLLYAIGYALYHRARQSRSSR